MRKSFWLAAVLALSGLLALTASAHTADGTNGKSRYVHGAPAEPSETWLLAAGGRIYDNWMEALGRKAPASTHPSYPASGSKTGAATWRCKECHGWDYRGRDGQYAKGSHRTGIAGIRAAQGRDPAAIARLLRAPVHGYTRAMIDDDELARVAAFVARGQHDADRYIDPESGAVKGDGMRGRAVFQTVCAACHGFDGRKLNWGSKAEPAYVGTEARANPWEVLHKIRNAHPGVEMVALRAFDMQVAVDALAYARTLPAR